MPGPLLMGRGQRHTTAAATCARRTTPTTCGSDPADGSQATNRQCRQFQIFQADADPTTYICTFYAYTALDNLQSYPNPGNAGTSRLYSTIPFTAGAGSPNAPPSPAAPPPPFMGAIMPDGVCNTLISSSVAGMNRVCRYYYTPKCTGDNNPLCGGETNTDGTFCRNGNYDSSIADNDPYNVDYCYKVPMVGYIPADGNNRPAYLHHVGTTEDCSHFSVQPYLNGMAARGYAPFCVHYPRTALLEYNGGWFDQKAQWIYSSTNPLNAINVICGQPGVDCALGIAVHGFSQGSHIASLSKKYEPRVTGILGFGAGCASTILFSPAFTARGLIYDHAQAQSLSGAGCWSAGSPTSTHPTQTQQKDYRDKSIYRVISGVNDEIFGHQQQMHYHTGYNCGYEHDCLQADGSGYYLIRAAENPQGDADGHNFFRNGNSLTTYFQNGAYPWSMNPNLDWLAPRARGENMLGYGIPPPPADAAAAGRRRGIAEGELCAYNQQAFKTCVSGTSCLVSDEQINPNTGTMQSRSHCCRNNHWWWMCKYTYRITGVVEYCRDDGQCDYGSGQCSGNGDSMTNIKYGICSGSWLPDRVDYDSNNMYVVTDPTTFYISDITGRPRAGPPARRSRRTST